MTTCSDLCEGDNHLALTTVILFQITEAGAMARMSLVSGLLPLTALLLLQCAAWCRASEWVNATQLNIEQDNGMKNYEEEEDGKVLPYR